MKTTTKVTDQNTDPSMEDILSSIRDIISGKSDEPSQPAQASKEVMSQRSPMDPQDQDILDLINMLKDDGSVEVVSPYHPSELSESTPINKKEAEGDDAGTEIETSLEDLAAELESEEGSGKKSTENVSKRKMPPAEEKALEEIVQTLSEMDQAAPQKDASDAMDLESFAESLEEDYSPQIEKSVTSEIEEDLLSEDALSEAAEALDVLNELAESATSQSSVDPVGDKTVEALMKEILRPLLKDWLDANLPSMVRTVVNEQVEKIVQQRVKGNRPSKIRKAS